MASNPPSQPHFGQPKRTSFSAYSGNNASMFLEKAKVGNRGSTPDSEALASSDDEQEHHHRLQSIANLQSSRPVRRASWLSEMHHAPQRKGSLGGGGTFSPNASHPTTPSNESTPWPAGVGSSTGSVTGRGHSSSTSIPWGSAIWSTEAQKGPPSRLTEVLPSPTTLVPPSSSGSFMEDPLLSPTFSREHVTESTIPFAIPLHPTLKSYRSQSYSVGQLDVESANAIPNNQSGYMFNNRSRSGVPYSGLQHRPSRPSMLGDLPHDASLLGQLREVEDDDESSTGSEADIHLTSTQARTIEQLARENAMLRQQAAEQLESTRGRKRPSFTDTNSKTSRHAFSNSQRVHGYVPEDGCYRQHEPSNLQVGHSYSNEGLNARRSSEYVPTSNTHHAMTGIPEHRNLESFKKGHWQSSLGFGGIVEAPQSRRHSFAEVPTRQTSISSSGEPNDGPKADQGSRPAVGSSVPLGYMENVARPSQGDSSEYTRFRCHQTVEEIQLGLEHLRDRKFAASYFSGIDASLRDEDPYEPSISPVAAYPPYPSNHLYSRPQNLGASQSRAKQSFSLVTFKACRGEIFYASEGTGLQFNPGDLVIVEADRGTDLGTVAEVNCSWARARELKERSTEEHYKWLMMFSRHGQNGTAAAHTLDGQVTSNGQNANPTATNGTSAGSLGLQDSLNGELKPKVIKRLAQAHEIQTLREKEGNEAKAKRVCQQKVADHRLNMEILDAEFQLDWKKLTFYYFADSYINFNPLVTDLFKIYKTRIWMSAINPASFVTPAPAPALPVPSGLGPGAFLPESGAGPERRQYRTSPTSTTVSASRAGYRDGRAWNATQDGPSLGLMPLSNAYPQSFTAPNFPVRQLDQYPMQYPHNAQQAYGIQPRYSPAVYSLPNLPHPLYASPLEGRADSVRTPDAIGAEWNKSFQGLSLGS
ncbi:MAG: hypothetical protein L6R42_001552 [Xanthoria sp. 1 TBL-2021]|nr:MAG: hypothetical protein L6R42_001552 [Xanthoria sp. 1 TBL-2021]